MAFREVTMLEVREILRLWLRGVPKKRIGQQLGFDVKTVRRYLDAAKARGLEQAHGLAALDDELVAAVVAVTQPATGRPRGEGWAVCEAHRDFIARHVDRGVRLTKIGKLLLRHGVDVEYPTLRRFALAELGFGRAALTVPIADCEPGQEVQLDTGWMTLLEPDVFGKRRRFRAWIFTAVRSRHRFVYPVFQETTATAIEACEAAWEFFGGVFSVVIPDNTKTIVTHADPIAPRITDGFLEYAQARGFVIDATRVRHPKDKARVERAVPTVRDDCFGGERLRTIEDARVRARRWCLDEYGTKRHSRTQRLPREHFEAEERLALLPAPTAPYDVPIWCDPKVAIDQFAAVARSLYSLPRDLRRHTLRARADSQLVRFCEHGQLVKTHPRVGPGKRSIDPADFPEESLACAQRDAAFFVGKAAEHGEHVGRFATALAAGPRPWTRMRALFKLIGLARKYGDRLDASCKTALDADMVDVYRLADLVRLDTRLSPPPAKVIPARPVPPAREPVRPPARTERAAKRRRRALNADVISPELKTVLRRLKLSRMLDTLPDRLALARQQKMPHQDLLLLALSDEATRRDGQAAKLRADRARLEPDCQLDRWDETAKVEFDRALLNELASLRFIESHHHVTVVGSVGVGKTFLAHALGHIACRRGYSVLAIGADALLKSLKHARLTQSHEKELRALLAVDLLIVDDFGLDAMDAQESRDAHEIIIERHRAGSMIVTSNRGPDEWLATFADPVRAQGAIDRFTSNAYDLVIEGESYRARLKPGQKPGQKPEKKGK